MDDSPSRVAQAKAGIEKILAQPEYENIPFRLARDWGINSSHFSRLFKKCILGDLLDDLLVEKGLLEKRPLKDPRPRVWMRTDDIDLAVDTIFKHYDLSHILRAMAHHPKGQDIVSVQFAVHSPSRAPAMMSIWDPDPDIVYEPLFPHFETTFDQPETSEDQSQAKE